MQEIQVFCLLLDIGAAYGVAFHRRGLVEGQGALAVQCNLYSPQRFYHFRNRPLAFLNSASIRRSATNRAINLAKVIVSEVQRDRSFKILTLLLKALVNRVSLRQCVRSV